ncbi:hypothetical protein WBG06_21610 [Nocardioides sp. CCNWLW239]|uniref:hypothetical protein n=1 Tax=Nocardioides sp. CCNWLW239 TaxID=3128902 RepID=UPI00301768BD
MDDDELEDLLRASAPRFGTVEDGLARQLVTTVVRDDPPLGTGRPRPTERRLRRSMIIGGAAAGVLVLSAAMTGSQWMMSAPPFMTLEPEGQRVYEPIEFVATWENGEQRNCQLFLEFTRLDDDELEKIAEHVRTKDWSRWQEDLSDAATDDSPDLRDRLLTELRGVVPGLTGSSESETAPAVTGYGTSCEDVR